MAQALSGCDAVISGRFIQGAVEVAKLCVPKLRLMNIRSAGYDEHNFGGPEVLDGLAKLGVVAANNGGANAVGVAEHTLMLMLMVCKNATEYWLATREGKWGELGNPGPNAKAWSALPRGFVGYPSLRELSGLTVGIIGFGNIGRLVARLLSGFRCKLLYYDVEELMIGREGELDAQATTLEELLQQSDIVTVHVPNLPTTQKMMGAPQFALMKPSAIYISTCRGPVTDEPALIDALETGAIFGAGLDVLASEPPSDQNPLLHMNHVVVTPHVAPMGTPPERSIRFVVDNLSRLDRGLPLLAVVNGVNNTEEATLSRM